jgi:hypothetical protein
MNVLAKRTKRYCHFVVFIHGLSRLYVDNHLNCARLCHCFLGFQKTAGGNIGKCVYEMLFVDVVYLF